MTIEYLFLFSSAFNTVKKKIIFLFIVTSRCLYYLIQLKIFPQKIFLNINNYFFLENGYIIIEWKCKNLLWVTVNNKTHILYKQGIILPFQKEYLYNPLNIKFQGIFSCLKESHIIQPCASIIPNSFPIPFSKIKIPQISIARKEIFYKGDNIKPVEKKIQIKLSPFLNNKI